ncbi:hypothetical protein DRQ15_01635 [candidate division KSB1 bacterium]|nr:MAG: hypothetical protein DRQ15_01635 [candidate division KSB1 bacterium]
MKKVLMTALCLLLFLCLVDHGPLNAQSDYRVGWETSMKKVFIKGNRGGFQGSFNFPVEISLAKNEYESFQLVVIGNKNLTGVRVVASDLSDNKGNKISAQNIKVSPVGYVEIKPEYLKPAQSQDIVGWWPDPILEFMEAVDIKQGDIQPFWVRVYVPKGAIAGTYNGKLTIRANNSGSKEIDIKVNVWDFNLPDKPSMTTAMHLNEREEIGGIYNVETGSAMYEQLIRKTYNFLMDYRIGPDVLYGKIGDIVYVGQLAQTRWLKRINLGYIEARAYSTESEFQEALESFISWLKNSRIPVFRKLGLMKYAYIYCFDEHITHPWAKAAVQRLQQEFPDIPLMTTGDLQDHPEYLDEYSGIDIWVRWQLPSLTSWISTVEEARRRGKEVWWYISVGGNKPNWNLENKLIETRLIAGAINAKYHPDGFLYWKLNNWVKVDPPNDHPIASGPYTDWKPLSGRSDDRNYFGDGILFYPGLDGPIPSIRLENFRDGMEDYEYYVLLGKLANANTTAGADLLSQAEEALQVNSAVVEDMSHYTTNPQILYQEREKVAKLILRLSEGVQLPPEEDDNPPAPPTGIKVVQ